MISFERVTPGPFADAASSILEESWPPPHICYTADYLRWQFRFPGSTPSLGVAAFDGDDPVGFAAVTPRRIRFREVQADAYLLSFVSVRPAWRSQGVAAGLYEALLGVVRELDVPIVTFAEVGSPGERILVRAYPAAGFHLRPLGTYWVYGAIAGPRPSASRIEARQDAGRAALLAAFHVCSDRETIWNNPDLVQLEHYQGDPRPRAMVLLQRPGEDPAGAAMLVRSEIVTARGISPMTMVESVFLSRPDVEVLRALVHAAGQRWSDHPGPSIVMAPNLGRIDPAVLRSAGIRQTPEQFDGYLATVSASHPLVDAKGTNLEIV